MQGLIKWHCWLHQCVSIPQQSELSTLEIWRTAPGLDKNALHRVSVKGVAQLTRHIKVMAMANKRKPLPEESEGLAVFSSEQLMEELQSRKSILIGRDVECDVVIKDVKASRMHCRLTRTDDGFLLEDLGSRNGTFVSGARIEGSVTLKPSQTFKAGDTVFYLSPGTTS